MTTIAEVIEVIEDKAMVRVKLRWGSEVYYMVTVPPEVKEGSLIPVSVKGSQATYKEVLC